MIVITSETPYNVRETPKASDTKPGVETHSAAEFIALGMVRIQRITVIVGDLTKNRNGQSAGKEPTSLKTWFSLNDRTGVGRENLYGSRGLRYSLSLFRKERQVELHLVL